MSQIADNKRTLKSKKKEQNKAAKQREVEEEKEEESDLLIDASGKIQLSQLNRIRHIL